MNIFWKLCCGAILAILLIGSYRGQTQNAVAGLSLPIDQRHVQGQRRPAARPAARQFSIPYAPVLQQSSATVSISAPAGPFQVGDTILVTVNLETGSLQTRGTQLIIQFDPAVVRCSRVTGSFTDFATSSVGSFYGDWARANGASVTSFGNSCDNVQGVAGAPFAAALLGSPGHGPSGSGRFANISFTALADGISDLVLTSVAVSDLNGEPYPLVLVNGRITVGNPPAVTSTSTPTRTLTPSPTRTLTPSPTGPTPTSTEISPTCVLADLNFDGVVNIVDITIFGGYYGQSGPPCFVPADFDCNGVVDVLDAAFLGYCLGYTYTPPPTLTPTATASATISTSPTLTPTPTTSGTISPSPTLTPTPTASGTISPSPTSTPTPTASGTISPSPTSTPTPTASGTPTPTLTPTPSITASASATGENLTATHTATHTVTPTRTPTHTATGTLAGGATNTPTITLTPTPGNLSVRVNPSTQTVSIGQEFTLNIQVQSQDPSRGAQALIRFDRTVLELVSMEEGNFYRSWAEGLGGQSLMIPDYLNPSQVNQTGVISTTAVSVLGVACAEGTTGTGDLFVLRFRSLRAGQSDIVLEDTLASLADPICDNVLQIQTSVQNGRITVSNQVAPSNTSTATRTATPSPSPTGTQSATPTRTSTSTPTRTNTVQANTATLTRTSSPAASLTPTRTATAGSGDPTDTLEALSTTRVGGLPTSTPAPTIASSSSMRIEPPVILAAAAGETYSVEVLVDIDKPSRAAEVSVQFDPSVVEILGITEGSFYKDWARENGGSAQTFYESPKFDAATGKVNKLATTVLGATGSDPTNPLGVTGKGSILKIEFKTKAVGVSKITLTGTVTDNLGISPPGMGFIPAHPLQLKITDGQVFVGVTPTPTTQGAGGAPGSPTPSSAFSPANAPTATQFGGGGVNATNTPPKPAATLAAQGTQVEIQVVNEQGTPVVVNAQGTAMVINEQGTPQVVDNPLAAPEGNDNGEVVNTVKIIGNLGEFIGDDGIMKSDVEIRSADGLCVVSLKAGTQALTKDNYPLEAIEIQRLSEAPPAGKGWALVGAPCQLGPEGAFFSPPVNLLMSYAGVSLPKGVAEKNLSAANYDPETGQWMEVASELDIETGIVKIDVDHFSMYAIAGKITGLSLLMLGAVLGSVLVEVMFGVWLIRFVRRRRAAAAEAIPVQETVPLLPMPDDQLPSLDRLQDEEIIEAEVDWIDEPSPSIVFMAKPDPEAIPVRADSGDPMVNRAQNDPQALPTRQGHQTLQGE